MNSNLQEIGHWLLVTGVGMLFAIAIVFLLGVAYVGLCEIAEKGLGNLEVEDIGGLLAVVAMFLIIAGLAIQAIGR